MNSAIRTLIPIVALARPHRRMLLAGAVLGTLAVGASIGLLATSGYLISRAALQPPILSLTVAIVGVRFFGLSRGILRYLDRLVSHDAALRTMATLRARLFARLEPLAPAELGDSRVGDLLSRFVGDIEELEQLFLRSLNPAAVAVGTVGLATLVATLISPTGGLTVLCCLVVSALIFSGAAWFASRRAARLESPARAELAAEVVEALTCAPELVAFGATGRSIDRVAAADRELGRVRRRSALSLATSEGGVSAAAGLSVVCVLAVATVAVHRDALDPVLVAALALLTLAAFEAIRPMPAAALELSRSVASGARIVALTDREPRVSDPDHPRPAPSSGAVEMRGVRLSHGDAAPVLDGFDLRIDPGELVALTGPSGCGKTTVANLLVRFLDPDDGAVLLDGHDLREYAQFDVRRAICLSGQDAHLFPTTIRQNILIGRPDAAPDQVDNAVAEAGLSAWVATLPRALDTEVGEDGRSVSGGQRQRIALARALLARPRLLILDEPDAHLDDLTAAAVIPDLLARARAARMGVLLITHRGFGVSDCDRVVAMETISRGYG
jgi:thiol reductant ABC exporter CydC subunit